MLRRQKLLNYLDELLQSHNFTDYSPNGLQVQGKEELRQVVTGVTASQALLEKAVALHADVILVHHGYFWRGEDPCVVGIKQQRLRTLLQNNINLIAYHLPLDAHAIYGNNAQFAKQLDIKPTGYVETTLGAGLCWQGQLTKPMTVEQFSDHLHHKLNRIPLAVTGGDHRIQRLVWCTGSAQERIVDAARSGADAFITGEASEQSFHLAKELGIHFFAAGHHATERYGIKALGNHLADHFKLGCQFVDISNPI